MAKNKDTGYTETEVSDTSKPLWREILEVFISLAVILIVLRLLLGAQMPVPLVAVVSCSMLHEDDFIGSLGYGLSNVVGPVLLDSACIYDSGRYWRDWMTERVPDAKIDEFPLRSGFSVGDMIIVITPDGKDTIFPFFSETKVGDIVIYQRDRKVAGNGPIIHRVVGIVTVRNHNVSGVDGTLDCFSREEFQSKFIPLIQDCQRNQFTCPYVAAPEGGDYRLYMTKGDNNKGTDQCSGILPITDKQVLARGWIRVPYVGWLKLVLNKIFGLVGMPLMLVR